MSKFNFKAKIWLYAGVGGWHFVTLPRKLTNQLRARSASASNSWGAIRVTAGIGKTIWSTSLFPDSKSKSYLLPVKASVRKAEQLVEGDNIFVTFEVIEQEVPPSRRIKKRTTKK